MKNECERIKVIFNQILPGMIIGFRESNMSGIKLAVSTHLPKLEKRTYLLADKCTKNSGCESDCQMCNPQFIKDSFENARTEMEK